MNQVVLPIDEDGNQNPLWQAIFRSFVAKSPSSRPDTLVRSAEYAGQTWVRASDNNIMKFISQGAVSVFNGQYAGTSMPEDRSTIAMKDSEMNPTPALEGEPAPVEAPKSPRRKKSQGG